MDRCKELLRPDNALSHLDSDNNQVVVDKKLYVHLFLLAQLYQALFQVEVPG